MITFQRFFLVLFILLSAPLVSHARLSSFTGAYLGGSFGYRNMSAKINKDDAIVANQKTYKFAGGGGTFEGIFGVGKAWKRLFLGYEFTTGFNNGRVKNNEASIGNNWHFGFAARIGAPVQDAGIMPFFGLGFEYKQMDFKTSTASNFYNYTLAPLVGVEFIVDDTWRLRAEGSYQLSVKTTNLPATYKFKTKPASFIFKGSVIYKIGDN